jgi:hypothetical protein
MSNPTFSTTLIDAAIDAAFESARSLGDKVARIAPVSLSSPDAGCLTETVQTDIYKGPKGSGFQIVGKISFSNGLTLVRIRQSGPEAHREKAWPSDIKADLAAWPLACLMAAESHVASQGYTATRLVTLLNAFLTSLTSAGGNVSALSASHPRLSAVYSWTQTVQAAAASGKTVYPMAPFTFADVIAELHV